MKAILHATCGGSHLNQQPEHAANGGVSFYRDEVERMIIDELISTIDNNYRTIAKGKSRALAGFSMGGFGSVYLSVQYPEMFCAAGSMGGGLWRMGDEFKTGYRKSLPNVEKEQQRFFLCQR